MADWYAIQIILVLLFVGFFFTVGIITSMRWGNRLVAARTASESVRAWKKVARPAENKLVAIHTSPPVLKPGAESRAPMREAPGPRDWEQRL
jgi:hypothetical protein